MYVLKKVVNDGSNGNTFKYLRDVFNENEDIEWVDDPELATHYSSVSLIWLNFPETERDGLYFVEPRFM